MAMFDFTGEVPKVKKSPVRKIGKTLIDLKKEMVLEKAATVTADQRRAFDALTDENGGNLFLTGSAGTGKSYCIQQAIYYLREMSFSRA